MYISQAVAWYLDSLSESNASNKTIDNYQRYLQRLIEFCGQTEVSDIDGDLIEGYRKFLCQYQHPETGIKLKPVTVNYFLIALRSLVKFLQQEKLTDFSYKQILLSPVSTSKNQILDFDKLAKIIDAPHVLQPGGLRDKAILALLLVTGLKVSQLVALNKEDIDLVGLVVVVHQPSPKRTIPLTTDTAHWLLQYLKTRHDSFAPLFIRHKTTGDAYTQGNAEESSKDLRLSARSIERIIQKYAKGTGIKKTVTPEILRQSFAKGLAASGNDLIQIQQLLGHQHLSTTKLLIEKVGGQFDEKRN